MISLRPVIPVKSTGVVSQCRNYLNQLGDISINSVSSCPKPVKKFLRENSPERLIELARLNCYAAKNIKEGLDKLWGENNYTLIAIGRSVSSVAELIGQMGADVKIIPLSDLRRVDYRCLKLSDKDKNTYRKFLESIGLSKKEMKNNPDRRYILMDYTFYGRSLENSEKFLREDKILGDAQNMIPMSFKVMLKKAYKEMGYELLLRCSRFKDYAKVGKLSINDIKDVFVQGDENLAKEYRGGFTQCVKNLFRFLTIDSLLEKTYNKKPQNEIMINYERFEAPEALSKRLARIMNKQKRY